MRIERRYAFAPDENDVPSRTAFRNRCFLPLDGGGRFPRFLHLDGGGRFPRFLHLDGGGLRRGCKNEGTSDENVDMSRFMES